MGSLGQQRRDENTAIIESEGRSTTVNGQTIKAFWQDANISQLHQYLNESEWGKDTFVLRLPYYATDAPYSIKNGVEVIRGGVSWRGVVRNVTLEDNDDTVIQVNALVVLTTQ